MRQQERSTTPTSVTVDLAYGRILTRGASSFERLKTAAPYSPVCHSRRKVVSPFGNSWTRGSVSGWGYTQRPIPSYHTQFILDTIALNNQLNKQAQATIDAMEPRDLWEEEDNEKVANGNSNGNSNGTSNGDSKGGFKGDFKGDSKGDFKGDVKGDVKPSGE